MMSFHLNQALMDVEQFYHQVIDVRIPAVPMVLTKPALDRAVTVLSEEIGEFIEATEEGKVAEAADALIDLTYFALGRLLEMGISPGPCFAAVQKANMAKVKGDLAKRPGFEGHDAVKPPGWTPPNLQPYLLSAEEFETTQMRANEVLYYRDRYECMSQAFKEAHALRQAKGRDYNDGVALRDYFPFGHQSYIQMMWLKVLRLISLTKSSSIPKHESIEDTILDLLNYASYYYEWIQDQSVVNEKEDLV